MENGSPYPRPFTVRGPLTSSLRVRQRLAPCGGDVHPRDFHRAFARDDALGMHKSAAAVGLGMAVARHHDSVLQSAGSMRKNTGFLGFALENACA